MSRQEVPEVAPGSAVWLVRGSDIVLETTDLWMVYPLGKVGVPALRGVDLRVHRGEFISIMGPSGCGKSTLLHIIGGLLTPTSGRVLVAGRDLARMRDRERTDLRRNEVGFVFQRFNLFPTLNVEENLALAQRIYANGRGPEARDPARRREILAAVGLEDKRRHKPSELSGGEQQRVALARAIINQPAILLADEPTGNLDSASSATVIGYLRELNRTLGQTTVMITHDPWVAGRSDRIVRMKDGKVHE